jgi:hypothetical protein
LPAITLTSLDFPAPLSPVDPALHPASIDSGTSQRPDRSHLPGDADQVQPRHVLPPAFRHPGPKTIVD